MSIMAHIRTEKQDELLGESSSGNLFHFPDSIYAILSGMIATKSVLISPPPPPHHHQSTTSIIITTTQNIMDYPQQQYDKRMSTLHTIKNHNGVNSTQ
jgi:hypothetical protein